MVMLIDISAMNCELEQLKERLIENVGMRIHVMHENIFNSMHLDIGGLYVEYD